MKSIYWVRHDLRWLDNSTLNAFCLKASKGLFVWCETKSFRRSTAFRRKFIIDSVIEFKNKVETHGGTFILSDQLATDFIPSLVKEYQIDAVFYTADTTTEEVLEQNAIQQLPLKIFSFDQTTLIQIQDLPMEISNLPELFTTFRKEVEKKLKIRNPYHEPDSIPVWPDIDLNKSILTQIKFEDSAFVNDKIRGGESQGIKRLQEYIWDQNCLKVYKETRNGMLEWNDSSKLSPWLSVGAMSPRTIYANIKKYELEVIQNESTYWLFFELLWRDYFRFISLKWGSKLFTGIYFREKSRGIVLNDRFKFEQWTKAETGDDFVDANMQELNQTGWMSNRGRQNVASYLAKAMQVDWVWGAQYFEQKLIDYDASSNWGNWSYLAGVGQDSRDRIFNTQRQAALYDSGAEYRRRWLKL